MGKIKQTNIFIAHTPLQNFIAESIVVQYFKDHTFVNRLYTSVNSKNNGLFDERELFDKNKKFKKVIQVIKTKREINNLIKKGNCQIFIPHTAALLDNYYFYTFPIEKYGAKINFYYEGILYFYKYLEPYKKHTHIPRKLMGFLGGFNYNVEPEILPVNNKKINKIYTVLKKFTLGPKEKIFEVSLLKENYKPNPGNILILGGKPSLLEDNEVISLYNKMIERVLSLHKDTKVFFKGHHADVSGNFEKANADRIKIIDISNNSPIEEIIEDYSPSVVLSYPSSGLVNLKAMYGDKIDVNCYYIEEKKEDITKLRPIFDELGIKQTLL